MFAGNLHVRLQSDGKDLMPSSLILSTPIPPDGQFKLLAVQYFQKFNTSESSALENLQLKL